MSPNASVDDIVRISNALTETQFKKNQEKINRTKQLNQKEYNLNKQNIQIQIVSIEIKKQLALAGYRFKVAGAKNALDVTKALQETLLDLDNEINSLNELSLKTDIHRKRQILQEKEAQYKLDQTKSLFRDEVARQLAKQLDDRRTYLNVKNILDSSQE